MNQQTNALYTEHSALNNPEHDDSMMQQISKSLLTLGFKPKLKGYIYTKEAIYFYILNPFVDSIVTDVYARIAQKYGITTTSVERAIRSSIECAWYRDGINQKHELFQYSYLQTKYHPTNSEFIATMAELIKLKVKM